MQRATWQVSRGLTRQLVCTSGSSWKSMISACSSSSTSSLRGTTARRAGGSGARHPVVAHGSEACGGMKAPVRAALHWLLPVWWRVPCRSGSPASFRHPPQACPCTPLFPHPHLVVKVPLSSRKRQDASCATRTCTQGARCGIKNVQLVVGNLRAAPRRQGGAGRWPGMAGMLRITQPAHPPTRGTLRRPCPSSSRTRRYEQRSMWRKMAALSAGWWWQSVDVQRVEWKAEGEQ